MHSVQQRPMRKDGLHATIVVMAFSYDNSPKSMCRFSSLRCMGTIVPRWDLGTLENSASVLVVCLIWILRIQSLVNEG